MSARPSEVKALADLLDNGDFESSKDAAKALILELERQRIDREQFVVACFLIDSEGCLPMVATYGPYPTRNKATEAIRKGNVPMTQVARYTFVGTLRTPQHTLQLLEEHDGNGAHR